MHVHIHTDIHIHTHTCMRIQIYIRRAPKPFFVYTVSLTTHWSAQGCSWRFLLKVPCSGTEPKTKLASLITQLCLRLWFSWIAASPKLQNPKVQSCKSKAPSFFTPPSNPRHRHERKSRLLTHWGRKENWLWRMAVSEEVCGTDTICVMGGGWGEGWWETMRNVRRRYEFNTVRWFSNSVASWCPGEYGFPGPHFQ